MTEQHALVSPSRALGAVLAAAALVVLPLALSEADIYKLGLVVIVFVGAVGLHILVNWAGELSLGHAALIGAPAFLVAKLSADHGVSTAALLPLGLLVGAFIGTVVGLPALRARGLQVALVTFAAAIAIDRYFFTKEWFVGPAGGARVDPPDLGVATLTTAKSLWVFLAVLVVLAVVVAWLLYHSKIARGLLWMSADPAAASAFGIPIGRYRVLAYSIAGAYAGFAGALTTMWVQRLTPAAFPIRLSFTYLIIVALAGTGFLPGVALAALFVEGGRLFLPGAEAIVLYGAPIGLIITLTRYRGGLNGALARSADLLRRRRPSVGAPEPDEHLAPVAAITPLVRPASKTPLLDVRDVRVSFGGLQAVDGVSLHVDEGAMVGLIGPNGAGKTTLFNCITGHQRINSGRVLFDGRDITRLRPHRCAQLGIGRSFQNLGLMVHETVDRNVMAAQHLGAGYAGWDVLAGPWRWARGERRLAARTRDALDAFGLAEEHDRPVEDLQFAAARFAELAAVVVESPRLVLLDEPTTGLDAAEIARLVKVLERLRGDGATVLVIAHDVGFVMGCCDYVYVLSEGHILSEGLPEDVQRDQSVIDTYLGMSA